MRFAATALTTIALVLLLPRLGDYLVAQQSSVAELSGSTSTTTSVVAADPLAASAGTSPLPPFVAPSQVGTPLAPAVTTPPVPLGTGTSTSPTATATPAPVATGTVTTPGSITRGTAVTGARTAGLAILALGLLGLGLQVRTTAVARLALIARRPARWRHRRKRRHWWNR